MGLTLKQRLFIDEYMVTGNATEAYRKVSPNAKNHNNLASRMLANVKIKEEIEARSRHMRNKEG